MSWEDGGFDWNGNGSHDVFDSYMDMQLSGCGEDPGDEGAYGSYTGNRNRSADRFSPNSRHCGRTFPKEEPKKPAVTFMGDSSKDDNSTVIAKSIGITFCCLGGILFPAMVGMGPLGALVCIVIGLGISFFIMKA